MDTDDEYSIFSTILPDIEDNPTILLKKKRLSEEYSVFSLILADVDEEKPTILQKNKNLSDESSISSPILADVDEESPTNLQKTPMDSTCTVTQTLTDSDFINLQNQELEIWKSEGGTSDRLFCCEPNSDIEDRIFHEVLELFLRGDLEQEKLTKTPVDFTCTVPQTLSDLINLLNQELAILKSEIESINRESVCVEDGKVEVKYFADEVLEWLSIGEETETEVSKKEKEEKRDSFEYQKWLFLIEKLRERHENLMKRRVKAARFGLEFSFLVAEYTFLTTNELLASEIEEYWMCLKQLGVNENDKGTSVIIGKLKEVFEIVMMMKKENREEHRNVKSTFRFEDYIFLCVDVIQLLGKIVWDLRKNNGNSDDKRVTLSDVDSWFEDCGKLLMKIELKLAEMKHCVYRSVSVDYESFSKLERFDSVLKGKVMNRVNARKGFGRSVVGSDLVEIWKSLFQAEVLQE